MVLAVTDPAATGRMPEPDPNHTLEERVVHWYFRQLDKNSSGDIGKKEIKPFKRLLRKKSKPKKCVKKFVEYCDISNDKALSLQELIGCLGVTKEDVGIQSCSGMPCGEITVKAIICFNGGWPDTSCCGQLRSSAPWVNMVGNRAGTWGIAFLLSSPGGASVGASLVRSWVVVSFFSPFFSIGHIVLWHLGD
ncbi:hypothetical protein P4O66_002061 [Electrophorus voltai]|uniref:EF-hand domain-containing protein n=1 Tax=Electrophorus voltai TaxID=2609070 RepID=A0AAD9DR40_9TELE|nr:hypothetical protein P4O66_002061 [Electrophorus voltai]